LRTVTLVEAGEVDDYRPGYSLLVLVDPSVQWDHEDPEVPRYPAFGADGERPMRVCPGPRVAS
jgi:hypothetical protein